MRFYRIILRLLLLFALCPVMPTPALAAAGTELSEDERAVLERIVASGKMVERIESRFTQMRYTSFMDENLISQGFFIYSAPQRLVWQYNSPAFFRLEYEDGKASFRNDFDQSGAPARENPREAELAALIGRQIMLWISFDLEAILASHYLEFKQLSPPVLLLSPKKKTASPVHAIELVFAANGQDVRQVIMHESDGDYIRLDFADAKRTERQPELQSGTRKDDRD